MRDALLRAGLITDKDKRRIEYEQEARRSFKVYEGKLSTLTPDEETKIVEGAVEAALFVNLPVSRVGEFVMNGIERLKREKQAASASV